SSRDLPVGARVAVALTVHRLVAADGDELADRCGIAGVRRRDLDGHRHHLVVRWPERVRARRDRGDRPGGGIDHAPVGRILVELPLIVEHLQDVLARAPRPCGMVTRSASPTESPTRLPWCQATNAMLLSGSVVPVPSSVIAAPCGEVHSMV